MKTALYVLCGFVVGMVMLIGVTVLSGPPTHDHVGGYFVRGLLGQLTGNLDANGNLIYDSTDQLDLGTACTDNHTFATGDACVGGKFQVDGFIYADSNIYAYTGLYMQDNAVIFLGSGTDGRMKYSVNQTPDSVMLEPGADSDCFTFIQNGDSATDFANDCTGYGGPAIVIQSDDQTSVTETHELYHDGTNAVSKVGSGDFKLIDDGGKGVASYVRTITESVTFAADPGDASKATTGSILPDGAWVFGVSGRVTTANTGGCTAFDVGDGSDDDIFANDIATTATTTFDTTDATASFSNPVLADGEITVTAVGGDGACDDMVVALTVHYFDVSAATSN